MKKNREDYDPLFENDIELGLIKRIEEDVLTLEVAGEEMRFTLSEEELKELIELNQKETVLLPVNMKTKDLIY